jgi:UDP-N-acetylglucosamine acyltransferase
MPEPGMLIVPTYRQDTPEAERPRGVHPLASIGDPPEHRGIRYGASYHAPEIHPTALIHAFCTVNGGLEAATRIGARTFLMAGTHVGHDAVLGDDCELGAHVVVCGHVVIGDRVRIGGGTWIKPLVTIGDDARIGGGSVVTKDVPAGETWAGNPAAKLEPGRMYWHIPDGRHGTEGQVDHVTEEYGRWWDESRG